MVAVQDIVGPELLGEGGALFRVTRPRAVVGLTRPLVVAQAPDNVLQDGDGVTTTSPPVQTAGPGQDGREGGGEVQQDVRDGGGVTRR